MINSKQIFQPYPKPRSLHHRQKDTDKLLALTKKSPLLQLPRAPHFSTQHHLSPHTFPLSLPCHTLASVSSITPDALCTYNRLPPGFNLISSKSQLRRHLIHRPALALLFKTGASPAPAVSSPVLFLSTLPEVTYRVLCSLFSVSHSL